MARQVAAGRRRMPREPRRDTRRSPRRAAQSMTARSRSTSRPRSWRLGARSFDDVHAAATGSLARHHATLAIRGRDIDAALSLDGSLRNVDRARRSELDRHARRARESRRGSGALARTGRARAASRLRTHRRRARRRGGWTRRYRRVRLGRRTNHDARLVHRHSADDGRAPRGPDAAARIDARARRRLVDRRGTAIERPLFRAARARRHRRPTCRPERRRGARVSASARSRSRAHSPTTRSTRTRSFASARAGTAEWHRRDRRRERRRIGQDRSRRRRCGSRCARSSRRSRCSSRGSAPRPPSTAARASTSTRAARSAIRCGPARSTADALQLDAPQYGLQHQRRPVARASRADGCCDR